MNKKEAKKYWRVFTRHLDEELWFIYYRVEEEEFRMKERFWVWQVVLEYQGVYLFKPDLEKILRMLTKNLSYRIDFQSKQIVIW